MRRLNDDWQVGPRNRWAYVHVGLLAALTASAMFPWLTCRPSFRLVDVAPALSKPLCEIGP